MLSFSSQKRGLYAMAMSFCSVCSIVRSSVACVVIRWVAAPGGEWGLIVSTPIYLFHRRRHHHDIQTRKQDRDSFDY